MKILDATTLIAIFSEIKCPDLIDKILQLNHNLVIPYHVMNVELLDSTTVEITKKLIHAKKLEVLNLNTNEEVIEFQKDFPGLGLGECDSLLTYQKTKNSGGTVYCILDDRQSRSKATELNVEFTGLIGLLRLLKERSIMTQKEIDDVVIRLRNSNFRLPADVVI